MKKLTLLITLCAVLSQPLFARSIAGNGKVVKVQKEVSLFKEIQASGIFKLIIRQGEFAPLTLETDENIIPLITTDVSRGRLQLGLKGDVNNLTTLTVYISIPELEKLELDGAASASLENKFTSGSFRLKISGASKVSVSDFTTKEMNIDLSGATKLTGKFDANNFIAHNSGASKGVIEGAFENMILDTDGASKTEIDVRVAKSVKLSASGTGKLTGNITAESITARASGASAIILTGSCKKQDLEASGSSLINMSKVDSDESSISASGASRIEVGRTSVTKMQSSGAASLKTAGAIKRKTITINIDNESPETKRLCNKISKLQLDMSDNNSEDLTQLGDEFVSLLNKLKKISDSAMIEVGSKTYLLKDVKISTARKSQKLILFINGEEVYTFN